MNDKQTIEDKEHSISNDSSLEDKKWFDETDYVFVFDEEQDKLVLQQRS